MRIDTNVAEERERGLAAAAAAVRRGQLVGLPLDTAYGVAADAFNPRGTQALREAKGRADLSIPVMVPKIATVSGIAQVDSAARRLMLDFWPGPLTLVLPAQPTLAWTLTDASGRIAVRMPLHPVALDLLERTGPLGVVAAAAPPAPARAPAPPPRTARPHRARHRGRLVPRRPRSAPGRAARCRAAAVRAGVRGGGPHRCRPGPRPAGTPGHRGPARLLPRTRRAGSGARRGGHVDSSASGDPPTAPWSPPMSLDTPFWGPDFDSLAAEDPEIAGVILGELDRLRAGLQLIASENFTSPAVLAALGSTLSNKYAEGYPGRRYYGGCAVVDDAETIGIERAKALFGADHANLQPHSGASANIAAYGAFMKPGETVLAMSLPHGGHLTHGTKVSFSGKWFNAVHYGVNPQTEDIDYDQVRDLAREHRPRMIICGGSAIPRLIDFAAFREISDEVGAILMVDAAHFIGLVAGRAIPSPVPYADVVTFTTHKVLRGPRGGMILTTAEHAAAIDKAVFPMMQGGPLMHAVAAKAVALKEAATPEYAQYARNVIANSRALTAGLADQGMRPVTGGTDTHLSLLDLQGTGVTGTEAEARCDAAGIVLNKNAIPNDPRPASVASGIRVGTPAVTTQGMGTEQMTTIATLIGRAIRDEDGSAADGIRAEVTELVTAFPAYPRA